MPFKDAGIRPVVIYANAGNMIFTDTEHREAEI